VPPNFRGEDFLNFSQSETRITHGDHGFCSMMKSYIGPFIDASCKIFPYLGKWSQMKRFFGNQPTRNNNCLWQSCLFTDRNEMSSLYRGPSIDASIPSFSSFGQVVSEEKIQMWKVHRCQMMTKAHLAFWSDELKMMTWWQVLKFSRVIGQILSGQLTGMGLVVTSTFYFLYPGYQTWKYSSCLQ
jgi:hypothetical protein